MVFWRIAAGLALFSTVFGSAAVSLAADLDRVAVEPRAAAAPSTPRVIEESTECVVWTNLGTPYPHLLNGCGRFVTVTVRNYSAGNLILERAFHLSRSEERNLTFPGDLMRITAVEGWVNKGEDGIGFLRVYSTTEPDQEIFYARNLQSARMLAVRLVVIENGQYHGFITALLPDAEPQAVFSCDPGRCRVEPQWAVLDPL